MKVWLDDVRNPKWDSYDDFVWVKTYEEAIEVLSTNRVSVISLDYDLGREKTGYDVVCWIEDQVLNHGMILPEIWCHSWNLVGRKRILAVIDNLENRLEEGPNSKILD